MLHESTVMSAISKPATRWHPALSATDAADGATVYSRREEILGHSAIRRRAAVHALRLAQVFRPPHFAQEFALSFVFAQRFPVI